jgi:hypothetical protein
MSNVNKSFNVVRQGTATPAGSRSLMWNTVAPGDPYDIRRSLIAKLPGDSKQFMGDNLELVCLFQAAEIERLVEVLDEYKLM